MKLRKRQYKELYQEVFGSPSGKLVLHDLCSRFHMMRSTKGFEDKPGDMDFKEGQRNVALFILSQVDYDLELLREERSLNKVEVIND